MADFNINPDFWQNLQNFGFASMAAGAEPGATTLGALGQGGMQAMKYAEEAKDSRAKNQYMGQETLKNQLENAESIRGFNARNEFQGLPTVDSVPGIPQPLLNRNRNPEGGLATSSVSPTAGMSTTDPQTTTKPASESNMKDYNIKAIAYGYGMPKTKEEALAALNMEGIPKAKQEILTHYINSDGSVDFQFNPVTGDPVWINKDTQTITPATSGGQVIAPPQSSVTSPASSGGASSAPGITLPPGVAGNPKATQAFIEKNAINSADTAAANQQGAASSGDIVGLYNTVKGDLKKAPSGLLQSIGASASNLANSPNKAAIAQGSADADLNNLYLAMIRSLKGTGRVMQAELDKISEAQPKSTDSYPVKMAKVNAHMAYYQKRMKDLGFDPTTGTAMGGAKNTAPKDDQWMSDMPDAGSHNGAVIEDDDGFQYKSDGSQWVPQ